WKLELVWHPTPQSGSSEPSGSNLYRLNAPNPVAGSFLTLLHKLCPSGYTYASVVSFWTAAVDAAPIGRMRGAPPFQLGSGSPFASSRHAHGAKRNSAPTKGIVNAPPCCVVPPT